MLLDGDQNYPRWLQAIDTARAHDPSRDVHRAQRRHRPALSRRAGRARPGRRDRPRPLRLVRRLASQLVSVLGAAGRCRRRRARGQRAPVPHAVQRRQPRSSQAADRRWPGGLHRRPVHRRRLAGRSGAPDSRAGATRAWSCAGPAVAEAELAFAGAWATWGEGLPPGTVPARESIRGRRRRAACASWRPRPIARRSIDSSWPRLPRPAIASGSPTPTSWERAVYIESLSAASRHGVDVRLLVPNNSDVRVGRQPVAHAVPSAARRRRPHLRMERPDGPRQDGRGRPAVRPSRIDEPEPVELGGQLGARRRHRGCGRRSADGGDLRPRPAQRHRDRDHGAQHRPAAIGAATPADGARSPAAPAAGPRRQRQRQSHDQGRRAGRVPRWGRPCAAIASSARTKRCRW